MQLYRNEKWLFRSCETRSHKILYGRNGIQKNRKITACKSRVSNKLGKKAAKKIRENECKKETRSDIIELDEMCISFKKTSGYGQQQNAKAKD